jgi:6-phosphofructo-2-kinase/fructose-2,6-biphosphatase 1
MAKIIVPALMAWNVGTRPIFLTRPGKTHHNVTTDEEDYVWRIDAMNVLDVSGHSSAVNSVNRKVKGEKLGSTGLEFRRELEEFMMHEGLLFMQRQKEIARHFSLETGTSRSGLSRFLGEESMDHGSELPFPCTILTSTMPRAAETVMWEQHPFPVTTISNLNPLDKGDFAGMELDEISSSDPDWYARLSADPYCTRYVTMVKINIHHKCLLTVFPDSRVANHIVT